MYPLIDIKNLTINFLTEEGTFAAVKNFNLTINHGEIVGIAGESGSGKSVTSLAILRLLGLTAQYQSGEILFSADGKIQFDLLRAEDKMLRTLRGKQIAMIFQEPMSSLNPVYTCGEQVAEAIRCHEGVSRTVAREKTVVLFEKVKLPQPAEMYDRYPHQLSGGQKQRVMIAMAMSGNPSLLICDEPTTALDVTVQQSVLMLIKELQHETGMGVIFITHDLGVIRQIADRVVIMYRGEIVEKGDTNRIFAAPQHDYTKALLACRPALYEKGKRLNTISRHSADNEMEDGRHEKEGEYVKSDIKRNISEKPKHGEQNNSAPLITVKNLTVAYPVSRNIFGTPTRFKAAVSNVSFQVYSGETFGLVGESGCGKTSLGRALLNLVPATHGEIWYREKNLAQLRGASLRRFRRNMQIVFQDPYASLNPSLQIGPVIAEPLRVHFPEMNGRERKRKVWDLLQKVGLEPSVYNRYAHEFSGGQRQRIVIARALITHPEFVVCDESVSALDVSVQAQVLNLLNDLKAALGFTIIFISHDLSVVRYMSDGIMVMRDGQIEEIGPASQVYDHPRADYTRRLIEAVPLI